MNTLLLTLLSLSALCTFYGVIKLLLLARDYNYRRSVFDDRVEGRRRPERRTERRSDDRRISFSNETFSSP